MKTNQVMIRRVGNFELPQRTIDGYFNASRLVSQWNSIEGNPKRDISKYLAQNPTKELINTIAQKEGLSFSTDVGKIDNQIVKVTNYRKSNIGRSRKDYFLHPILFIDFAMWISPFFKYDVIKFAYDQMIEYRKEAGDAYNDLSAATQKLVGKNCMRHLMPKVANAINFVVFNCNEKMIRNKVGEESKMKELFYLEHKLADLINEGFINTYKELIKYLRDRWIEKFQPKALSIDNK